jgi:hypothetical protein|tara:strand:- start:216 stop:419 length:204 start_codon:yes stop_codon:yes gene_type:complete
MSNRILLESAQNILRYVVINNGGVIPTELLDDVVVLSEEEKEQILEDLYHDEQANHLEMMRIMYGDE